MPQVKILAILQENVVEAETRLSNLKELLRRAQEIYGDVDQLQATVDSGKSDPLPAKVHLAMLAVLEFHPSLTIRELVTELLKDPTYANCKRDNLANRVYYAISQDHKEGKHFTFACGGAGLTGRVSLRK